MFGSAARVRWLAVPVVALSIAGLAACGSTVTPTAVSTATGATGDAAAAGGGGSSDRMAAFDQCMSQHGVTKPAGARGPGGAGGPGGASGGAGAPAAGGQGGAGEGAGGQVGPPPASAGGQKGRRDMATAPPGIDQATWTTARTACASVDPGPPSGGNNS